MGVTTRADFGGFMNGIIQGVSGFGANAGKIDLSRSLANGCFLPLT